MTMIKTLLLRNRKKGFTLVGVLGASFFAIIVVVALTSSIAQIYKVANSSRNRYVAINLAKEGIELVRNMRDSNWLYYPDAASAGTVVSDMKWRGEATDTACPSGDACGRLRSICDGGPYTIDALDRDLTLRTDRTAQLNMFAGTGASLVNEGVYTHNLNGTPSPFSREIFITTETADEAVFGFSGTPFFLNPADYVSVSCGTSTDFSSPTRQKPLAIKVLSRVTWTDPGSSQTKQIEMTAKLYDSLTQRP